MWRKEGCQQQAKLTFLIHRIGQKKDLCFFFVFLQYTNQEGRERLVRRYKGQ
ncbi:hypothetical protein GQ55_9G238100 [Panicum hallii var. hallii]|uniref:Uncharacterized protein n=1 Tax=Panicum hallii var. hallii TaxID=1504633 RepID=A0A2T7C6I8_9POAL|nr:hypothetical protein GQ55_9G238100 [Panicum hallii var. hallii]